MLLWNPAIHQFKELTLPLTHSHKLRCIGFGFDPVNNDYKVVVCYFSVDFRRAYVYSSKSDSWIQLYIPYNVFPDYIRHRSSVAPTTIVKNCPYWKFTRYSCDKLFKYVFAVKFDVGSNEFKLLPSFCSHVNNIGGCQNRFTLVNMKDSLTLMVYEVESKFSYMVDVYSLDDEGCWVPRKMYSIGVNHIEFARLAQGFEYGGETVFTEYGKFICYDHKTDTKRHIRGCDLSRSCFRNNPSLVLLPGMKSVHSQTQISGH